MPLTRPIGRHLNRTGRPHKRGPGASELVHSRRGDGSQEKPLRPASSEQKGVITRSRKVSPVDGLRKALTEAGGSAAIMFAAGEAVSLSWRGLCLAGGDLDVDRTVTPN